MVQLRAHFMYLASSKSGWFIASTQRLQVIPAYVENVSKFPFRKPKTVLLNGALQLYADAQSIKMVHVCVGHRLCKLIVIYSRR